MLELDAGEVQNILKYFTIREIQVLILWEALKILQFKHIRRCRTLKGKIHDVLVSNFGIGEVFMKKYTK